MLCVNEMRCVMCSVSLESSINLTLNISSQACSFGRVVVETSQVEFKSVFVFYSSLRTIQQGIVRNNLRTKMGDKNISKTV